MPYYIPSIGGFDHTDHGGKPPKGYVFVSDEDFERIFAEVSTLPGGRIIPGEGGRPIVVGPEPLNAEQLADAERAWRDGVLIGLFALRDRHRDEVELGVATTLTAGQFGALLGYVQQLREWPQAEAFPEAAARPVPPDWLADMPAS